MTRRSPSRPIVLMEAPRDQVESEFTPILRELWSSEPEVLAICFVDHEGECVDYCGALSPFDTKIAGAQILVTMTEVGEFARRIHAGNVSTLEILGTKRDLIGRRVGDGYMLVLVVRGQQSGQRLHQSVDRAAQRLREEAGIAPPVWDPVAPDLQVQVREAVGWPYAPAAFVESGERHEILAVLGRWEEDGGIAGGHLVCFRVRIEDGTELTLAYDDHERLWLRW